MSYLGEFTAVNSAADADKLDGKDSTYFEVANPNIQAHVSSTSNPHATSAAQVGADPSGTASTLMGNHIAAADPHTQYVKESELVSLLPSYVDDVLEYANLAAFPATGESGKVYVDVEFNKTYRWSGTAYVVIGSDLALGETSSTAYRGDRGKTAYDHSQAVHAPSDAEANVNADWNASSGAALILNKPTIPSITGLLNETSHDVLDHAGLTGVLALGTTGTTACAGNDSRLSDARTPVAHNQAETTITFTDIVTGNASTTAHGFAPKATAPAAGFYNYLGITNGETAYTNKELFDAAAPTTQAFGDTAVVGTAASAARRDHKHAMPATTKDTTAITGLLKGNGTSISAAVSGIDYASANHAHGNITSTGYLGLAASIPLITGPSGIIQAGSFGTAAGTFAAGDHNHSGTYAAVSQTFYIGTTQVAINRASAALTLTGITLTTPDIGTPSAGTLTNCTKDGTNGVGYLNIPQNSQSTAYTLVLADAGKHILHPSADTTARTFTIPANASVPYPIGTAITFVNQVSAGVMTIAITSDTMRLAGAGTTGSRTLAANGVATAIKLTSTEWIISGSGLT